MRLVSRALPFCFLPLLLGCPSVPPPASQVPTGQAAIDRIRETQACGKGLQGVAKIDHFGKAGRFRGKLLFFASAPANLEMEAQSPFGINLATLTSNGQRFAFLDLREKAFLVGPAAPCNIARLTSVPIPGHAMVDLLRGLPPILKHDTSTIEWDGHGYYLVRVPSSRGAVEELHLAPHPADMGKPWKEQRLRLLDVRVVQSEVELYHAELDGHAAGKMASPRPTDPETGEPGLGVSGPECHADVPRSIHLQVPSSDADVIFTYDEAEWNPPLPPGVFDQQRPAGMQELFVDCPADGAKPAQ